MPKACVSVKSLVAVGTQTQVTDTRQEDEAGGVNANDREREVIDTNL